LAGDSPHVPISFLYLKSESDNQHKVKTSEEEEEKILSVTIPVLNFIHLCL